MILTVENLSYAYQKTPVLMDLSFQTHPGLTAVLGPNGAGKSTLFQCMLGLKHGYTGSIRYGSQEVSTLSARQLAQVVAYISQSHHPAFDYSVYDVVLMGTTGRLSPYAAPGKRERAAAQRALELVGITHLAQRDFLKLSGGEQQLVLASRALAQETEVLIMDEPTANLDYGNQIRVLECVKQLAANGYTVLLSTHNPQNALSYADKVLALQEGRVLAYGAPQEVLTAELIKRLYGINVSIAGQQIVLRR